MTSYFRFAILVFCLMAFSMTMAGPGLAQEVGNQASSYHEIETASWNTDTELDLSVSTLFFTGEDMRKTYSVFPMLGVGASFRMAPETRLTMGLRYGQKSGNPYYQDNGFESGPDSQLKTLRYLMGMKYNLSRTENFKVYVGISFALGWAWEKLSLSPIDSGLAAGETANGWTTGFQMTFAPEWTLSPNGRALGMELGYGGTKGELTNNTMDHAVDITGLSGRIYYVIKL